MNSVLEHSEMIIIDGTGHEVNVEVPNKLAAIIQKAIGGVHRYGVKISYRCIVSLIGRQKRTKHHI